MNDINSVPATPTANSASSEYSLEGTAKVNFTSSVGILITYASISLILSGLPVLIAGYCQLAAGIFFYQWYYTHGGKMTRIEHMMFDERNLLATSTGLDMNHPPLTAGTTPISGPDVNPDAPTTLWQAIFCDEKEMQMQKFYKEHYGPVWETAKRREQELKNQKKMESETNSKDDVTQVSSLSRSIRSAKSTSQ